jgi:hypothetical protein
MRRIERGGGEAKKKSVRVKIRKKKRYEEKCERV